MNRPLDAVLEEPAPEAVSPSLGFTKCPLGILSLIVKNLRGGEAVLDCEVLIVLAQVAGLVAPVSLTDGVVVPL